VLSLPTLAYVYDPLSFAPLSIVEAAEGICSFLWIVDSSKPDAALAQRLLRRFGPVIDSSSLSFEELVSAVRTHAPHGILSMHDGDLVSTARLAEELGLRFHSLDTAHKLTDKNAQRRALAAAGLAVPMFLILPRNSSWDQVTSLASAFSYPAVLKPRWGQSSRNTLPVSSLSELLGILDETRGLDVEDYVLEGYVSDTDQELGWKGATLNTPPSVREHCFAGRFERPATSPRAPSRMNSRQSYFESPAQRPTPLGWKWAVCTLKSS